LDWIWRRTFSSAWRGCVGGRHFPQETAASTRAGILCNSTGVHRSDGGLRRVPFLGREIGNYGHRARLIPPAYVKPFVKRQKNDAADAEAICEAAQRPTMRFVAVKSEAAQGAAVVSEHAICWCASVRRSSTLYVVILPSSAWLSLKARHTSPSYYGCAGSQAASLGSGAPHPLRLG